MRREGLWLEGRLLQLQWGDGGDPPKAAIWHHTQSHRKPDSSEIPNRRDFASLDVQKHVIFFGIAGRATWQDFRGSFLEQNDYYAGVT